MGYEWTRFNVMATNSMISDVSRFDSIYRIGDVSFFTSKKKHEVIDSRNKTLPKHGGPLAIAVLQM